MSSSSSQLILVYSQFLLAGMHFYSQLIQAETGDVIKQSVRCNQVVTLTAACGINNRGQIVGLYNDESGQHGFLLSGGTYTTINFPGASTQGTQAQGINNRGDIVGVYSVNG